MAAIRSIRSAGASALLALTLLSLGAARHQPPASATVLSPDGRTAVTIATPDGRLSWSATRDGRPLVMASRLGYTFRDAPALGEGMRIVDQARTERDETFTLPWGEVDRVRDHHRELRVKVAERDGPRRELWVVVRLFDDGLAFRYELPAQPGLGQFEIMEELTEFAMAEDMKAWWAPADVESPDRQEMLYASSPISRIRLVHTPLTLQGSTGVQAVIHEADLVDYAGMYLQGAKESRTLRASLAKWKDGAAVKGSTPFRSPWRTVQLADSPALLAPSLLALKLNPPSRLADTRWITPMKYDGIWWGMHVNTMTWSSGPLHGATTANARRYIDFAAANGLGGTLVEGWNLGWDVDWMKHGDQFSFSRSYPDYDLPGIAAYARQKGVALIVHNETGTFIENYERQLDSAFALYERLGVRVVKTGYVGDTVNPGGHAHQSQYMVRHHRRVIETAARHGISVVMHEPIKDTGERRTWPNMLSREGSRGMEFNAWGGEGGNPPEHETILFFTRLLSGPTDFTPGILDLTISRSGTNRPRAPEESRPRSTLARQLALYVVLYSPVQMAADLIENYAGQPGFQFIRDVAVDWDETRVLHGRIGDAVVVARKAKGKDEWFIGGITDEEAREVTVRLDFLPAGRRYVAEIYADGPAAHWRDAPSDLRISRAEVGRDGTLRIAMAPGGGQAIRIVAATAAPGAGAPGIDKVEPPDWWAGHSVNPVRLLIRGRALIGARFDCGALTCGDARVSEAGTYAFVDVTIPAAARPRAHPITLRTAAGSARFDFTVHAPLQRAGRFQGVGPGDVLYLIMPDRFANGDPSNDDPPRSRRLHDRGDPRKYHGGDLEGVRQRLPYLKDLGVTAVWLTPVHDNVDTIAHRAPQPWAPNGYTDYHGYGATDLYAVEEHLGDLAAYRRLVDEAHALGMKVILDHVGNHTGPEHVWAHDPPTPTWFAGTRERHLPNNWQMAALADPYAAKAVQDSTLRGWFANILPDLDQSDPEVERYLIQNTLWWIGTAGVDAVRQDTWPYVPRAFWAKWMAAIRREHPRVTVVAEVLSEDAAVVAFFEGTKANFDGVRTGVDQVFDFPLQAAVRRVFLHGAPVRELAQALGRDRLYDHPERLVTVVDNHDLDRLPWGATTGDEGLLLAYTFLFTTRGIPQLYYGNEIGMTGGHDPDNRRDFPGGWREDARNAFEASGREPREQRILAHVRALLALRRARPELQAARTEHLLVDDAVYVYRRGGTVVAINNGAEPRTVRVPGLSLARAAAIGGCDVPAPDGDGVRIVLGVRSGCVY